MVSKKSLGPAYICLQLFPRMCSEGVIFRKQHANRPTLFDFSTNPLDTGKNSNIDTEISGADTLFSGADTSYFGVNSGLSTDTNPNCEKGRTLFSVSELL